MRHATFATVCYPGRVRRFAALLGLISLPFATAAWGGCGSSAKSVEPVPGDAGGSAIDGTTLADDGNFGPQVVPPRLFAVHAAHMQAFAIGDVRLCPSDDPEAARPNDNRIPRASYPGVVRGGFAEIENPGMWSAPFALDAYGLGIAEGQTAIPCSQLNGDFYVKVRFPSATPAKPGIVALVDGLGDAGAAPELLPIPIASTTAVPAFQVVNLSRDLVTPRLIVRQGPLDGKCPKGELFDGQGTFGAALNAPLPFTPPAGDFDTSGIQVCAAPLNGMPALVISRSWAELQAASVPEMVPGELYARKALFVIVLVGEKTELHAVVIPFEVAK